MYNSQNTLWKKLLIQSNHSRGFPWTVTKVTFNMIIEYMNMFMVTHMGVSLNLWVPVMGSPHKTTPCVHGFWGPSHVRNQVPMPAHHRSVSKILHLQNETMVAWDTCHLHHHPKWPYFQGCNFNHPPMVGLWHWVSHLVPGLGMLRVSHVWFHCGLPNMFMGFSHAHFMWIMSCLPIYVQEQGPPTEIIPEPTKGSVSASSDGMWSNQNQPETALTHPFFGGHVLFFARRRRKNLERKSDVSLDPGTLPSLLHIKIPITRGEQCGTMPINDNPVSWFQPIPHILV